MQPTQNQTTTTQTGNDMTDAIADDMERIDDGFETTHDQATIVTKTGIPIRNTLLTPTRVAVTRTTARSSHTCVADTPQTRTLRHTPVHKHDGWQFTNSLLLHRITKRISQQELADKVNVSRQTISRIEKFKQEPLASLAIAIAEALETNVESIFKLHGRPAAPWRADPWISSRKKFRETNGVYQRPRNAQLRLY